MSSRKNESFEKMWEVSGVYANWRLVITVDPPDGDEVEGGEEVFRPQGFQDSFQHLYDHFFAVVNWLEFAKSVDAER